MKENKGEISLESVVVKAEDEMKGRYKKAVILPDIHVPDHDMNAILPILRFIKDIQPDMIVSLGDFYDFHDVSKFDKDPTKTQSLQKEIDEGKKLWKAIKACAPKAELYLLTGNHEQRLHKYLLRNPELYSLSSLKLENILELKEYGVKIIPVNKDLFLNKNLLLTHGAQADGGKLSTKSGYTANANLLKKGVSGISGHSHRLGASFKTDYTGTKAWYEAGCLSKLDPEYTKRPDWQHGFIVAHYGSEFFHVQMIPITESYNFYYGGKLYSGKATTKKTK